MLEILEEKEFNDFSRSFDNSIFFQSSYWGKLKQGTGWRYEMVGIKEDNQIKCAALLLSKKIPIFNRYIYYSPRGFLLDYSDLELLDKFTSEIVKFVKKKKGIFFKINPLVIYQERDKDGNIVENGFDNKELVNHLKKLGFDHVGLTETYGHDLEPRWISVLDVKDKTYDDIQANFRSTKRWDIKDSYKYGLKLVEIDESRMKEFKDLMSHTGERRGFIDRPLSYYNKMYQEFSKTNDIKVLLVELNLKEYIENYQNKKTSLEEKIRKETEKNNPKENLIKELNDQLNAANKKIDETSKLRDIHGDNIVVAGGLFMLFGKQVVSLFGASYKEFMKYKGQYFLNNEMIKYAIDNNYDKYNFYGITGDFSESSPMFGLFDFKRGFGSDVNELIGEFTYITDKTFNGIYNFMFKVYRILKKVKK